MPWVSKGIVPQNAHWFSDLTVHPSRILAARTLAARARRIEKGFNRVAPKTLRVAEAFGTELGCLYLRHPIGAERAVGGARS